MEEVKRQGGMVSVHATNGDMIDYLVAKHRAEENSRLSIITCRSRRSRKRRRQGDSRTWPGRPAFQPTSST